MADYYFQHTLKKDPSNGDAMLAYAQFLRQHRKDAPGALALYRKAAELYIIWCHVVTEVSRRCAGHVPQGRRAIYHIVSCSNRGVS